MSVGSDSCASNEINDYLELLAEIDKKPRVNVDSRLLMKMYNDFPVTSS
ncbi:MAG: hypothetical protein PHD71_02830 [Methanospirillum sp.]|nr:hypothetical protein [Methanospirillum sp.]